MRFEVPQFIEVEDKVFGPFTWKQFIYLGGGAGAGVALFLTLPFIFFLFLGVPILGLAGFLAFHQVNNRPFSFFLESVFSYFTGKKLYLWKKQSEQTVIAKSANDVLGVQAPHMPQGGISSLSSKLELNTIDQQGYAE